MELDVKAWKRERRLESVERRMAVPAAQREDWDEGIRRSLVAGFGAFGAGVVGFCWPYKGELDARPVIEMLRERGARSALPVVVAPRTPLAFHEWWPGVAMAPGVYDIPIPQDTPVLYPDLLIVPMNGFDPQGFRLGYGGGFFDRTLAAIAPQPVAIGVAYDMQRMDTINPDEHDIRMDFIVTESGICASGDAGLESIESSDCAARLAALLASRGLPREQRGSS